MPGSARNCSSAGGQCMVGVCDDVADKCVAQNKPDGTSCVDNNACTNPDTCLAGKCIGTPLTGTGCNDNKECTDPDTCTNGQCIGTPKPTGTACGVGQQCCNGQCCAATSTCCADTVCCGAGVLCCPDKTCKLTCP